MKKNSFEYKLFIICFEYLRRRDAHILYLQHYNTNTNRYKSRRISVVEYMQSIIFYVLLCGLPLLPWLCVSNSEFYVGFQKFFLYVFFAWKWNHHPFERIPKIYSMHELCSSENQQQRKY